MRHAELYAEEEGFKAEFEVLVAEILAAYMRNHDPDCERAWIAEQGGQRLGSIFCVRQSRKVAKLRLFFLEPQARGLGLGQKMLDMCMGYARGKGYEKMVLWTHESHEAACALYRKFGFELIDSKPERSFGRDLVTQNWQIAL
ncbi:GNAT family N-acetyltransferase [Pseudohalocynthiibacter sp. F2068]|nr:MULTISPECIES: GNAT family N-acetyltransferase [Pseudohalocynthiibacter]MCK0102979.1 GNAT family N-acetyltransferase [Pseudohalocynthiibacter sp. F2068]